VNSPLRAGQIVIAGWRDARPLEPKRLRPAAVVEDGERFDPAWPCLVLLPIAEDARPGIADPSLPIAAAPANGRTKPCHALATHVTATSKARIEPTESAITPEQLATSHARFGIAPGL
jgi:hypothetical protein